MWRFGGIATTAACAALVAAPAAQGAQGNDFDGGRGHVVQYAADAGEANALTIQRWDAGGAHLRDPGAIIRWTSVPGLGACEAVVHDVFCTVSSFAVEAWLGDGADSYAASIWAPGTVALGEGDDAAVGGPGGQSIDGGPGADRLSGGGSEPGINGGPFPEVLTGGPGRDVLRADEGEPGETLFAARDGEVDRIWCGAGVDHVQADPFDVLETPRACEDVQRAASRPAGS